MNKNKLKIIFLIFSFFAISSQNLFSVKVKNCAICLEALRNKKCKALPCYHTFHEECIEKYKGNKCPLCKRANCEKLNIDKSQFGLDKKSKDLVETLYNEEIESFKEKENLKKENVKKEFKKKLPQVDEYYENREKELKRREEEFLKKMEEKEKWFKEQEDRLNKLMKKQEEINQEKVLNKAKRQLKQQEEHNCLEQEKKLIEVEKLRRKELENKQNKEIEKKNKKEQENILKKMKQKEEEYAKLVIAVDILKKKEERRKIEAQANKEKIERQEKEYKKLLAKVELLEKEKEIKKNRDEKQPVKKVSKAKKKITTRKTFWENHYQRSRNVKIGKSNSNGKGCGKKMARAERVKYWKNRRL